MRSSTASLLAAAVALAGCVMVRDAEAGIARRRRPAGARVARPARAAAVIPPPSHVPAPQANFRISSGSSNAVATGSPAVELGVYTGLGFQGGRMYPAWADNSTTLPANPDLPTRNLDIATTPLTVSGATVTPGALTNVSAAPLHQYQPAVAVDPSNPLRAVIVSDHGDLGLFKSTTADGGITWNSATIATGADGLQSADGSASLAWDSYGNLFLAYLHPLPSGFFTCALAVSTNAGATFSPVGLVGSGDLETPTVATGPGLSGNGSVWISYYDFLANGETGAVRAAGAPVTGLGVVGSFTAQSAPGSSFGFAPDLAIGPSGQVLLTYQDGADFEGPSELSVHLDNNGLTAGGFGVANSPATSNVGWFEFIPAQAQQLGIDAEVGLAWDRSGGPHNGRVYLVYTDEVNNESNNTDIVLRYSDNNGSAWSAPIRVNDDAGTRSQYLPRIAVDQSTGNVAITWYDCRNDAGIGSPTDTDNLANTDAEYWGALVTADVIAGIHFSATTYTVSEGAGNAALAVVRTGDATAGATVQYATSNGTALAGSDYTATSGTVTFGPGEVSKPILVPLTPDSVLEPAETFTLTLTNPAGGVLGSPVTTTVTLADDGALTAPSAVTATPISTGTIRIAWTDNSTNEDDFLIERKVDAGAFQALASPTASPYNDNTVSVGSVYTYRVRARKGALQSANSPEVVASIVTFQLSAVTFTGPESAGSVVVTVIRAGSPTGATSVDLQLSGGTATAGVDYTAPATVTFAANETSKSVSIPVTADDQLEATETVTVTLVNSSAGTLLGTPASATVSIVDDPAQTTPGSVTAAAVAPGSIRLDWTDRSGNETQFSIERQVGIGAFSQYATVSANATTYTDSAVTPGVSYTYRVRAVGAAQSSNFSGMASATVTVVQFTVATQGVPEGQPATLTVTRAGDTTIPLTVAYASADISASSPADYTAVSGTLAFAAGETSKSVPVSTVADALVEGAETFRVDLGTVTGAGVVLGGAPTVTVTITDDPVVTPSTLTATVVNATTVRLDWTTTAAVPTQIVVERRTGAAGQFVTLTTTASGVLTYLDTTVTTNTDYTYRVRATSGGNQSAPSPEASVRIAAGAKASVTPTKLNFGTVRLPATPRTKTVKIKNAGKVELRGTVGTPTGQFEIVSGGGSFILAPKQTRSVVVRMTLAAPGTAAGTLLVTTTDPKKASVTVKLSGKAK
jgi:hypothetical protein